MNKKTSAAIIATLTITLLIPVVTAQVTVAPNWQIAPNVIINGYPTPTPNNTISEIRGK